MSATEPLAISTRRLKGPAVVVFLALIRLIVLAPVDLAVAADETPAPFPTAATTGVPEGWRPRVTETSDVRVTKPGAIVEDVRLVGASLLVDAENVTVRRVEIAGGSIVTDSDGACRNGLLIEDVSIVAAAGQATTDETPPAIAPGGYTARRVKIDGLPEGFRVGGRSLGCGPVVIEDSFARIVPPTVCRDWHGDALQGYDGPALTIRNVSLQLIERPDCAGTAPFFYPGGQANSEVDIDRLLVRGGGFPFRLGMPGRVRGLRIVAGSWGYAPADVDCSLVTEWEAGIVPAGSEGKGEAHQLPCGASGRK